MPPTDEVPATQLDAEHRRLLPVWGILSIVAAIIVAVATVTFAFSGKESTAEHKTDIDDLRDAEEKRHGQDHDAVQRTSGQMEILVPLVQGIAGRLGVPPVTPATLPAIPPPAAPPAHR